MPTILVVDDEANMMAAIKAWFVHRSDGKPEILKMFTNGVTEKEWTVMEAENSQ
jgi:hypothetical protein